MSVAALHCVMLVDLSHVKYGVVARPGSHASARSFTLARPTSSVSRSSNVGRVMQPCHSTSALLRNSAYRLSAAGQVALHAALAERFACKLPESHHNALHPLLCAQRRSRFSWKFPACSRRQRQRRLGRLGPKQRHCRTGQQARRASFLQLASPARTGLRAVFTSFRSWRL